MRKRRFTEEQIISILKEQEAGAKTQDLYRRHGISGTTFFKWKAKFGALEASDAKRLRSAGGREPASEEAVGGAAARQCSPEGIWSEKTSTPRARPCPGP